MEKQYRYPGTRPFQEDDRELFFGRNNDIEKLTELIVLEKMVVLFSKSGYGKSSLLNAGVIPRLKEVENFQTLNIRLNDPERNPLELLNYHLQTKDEKNTFLASKFNIPSELPDDISAKLWYYAKSIQLSQKDAPAQVLIFDQFEELFNYPSTQVKDFASELATLHNPNLNPLVRNLFKQKIAISKGYFTKEETDLLLEPLNLKVVFSLRSDRISFLNQLKDSIPAVFKKTYELQPLNEAQAREALLEPAGKEGDFISPKFSFAKDSQELILTSLIDKEYKRIETFQLQLICQHAEEEIIKKQRVIPSSTYIELTADELGKPEDIFEYHYNTIIGNLPEESRHKARILIEDKLIIGENRVPLPESVITTEHHISRQLLKNLVDKRLLRSEPNTVGGTSYELSHDTLVAPIQKTAQIRREKESEIQKEIERIDKTKIKKKLFITRVWLVLTVLVLVFSIVAVLMAFEKDRQAKNANFGTTRQRNITKAIELTYLAKDLLLKGSKTEALRVSQFAYNKFLAFDTTPSPQAITNLYNSFYDPHYFNRLIIKDSISIEDLAFSQHEDYVIIARNDIASIWDLKGNHIQDFDHKDFITSVDFSPDGKSVLTCGGTRAIIWDTKGNISKTLNHSSQVNDCTFSPNGVKILTGNDDQTATLWDLKEDSMRVFKNGHSAIVSSVSFSHFGDSILTGGWDGKTILWDLNGNILESLNNHKGRISSVAFSQNGNLILTGGSDKIAVLTNLKERTNLILSGQSGSITSVQFSPKGNSLMTGSSDKTAILWDIDGKQIKAIEDQIGSITSLKFSPDGNSVFSGNLEGEAILWDLNETPVIHLSPLQDTITSIDFSPNGKSIIVGSSNGKIIHSDLEGKTLNIFGDRLGNHSSYISTIVFAPNGKSIISVKNNYATLWNLNGIEKGRFKHNDIVTSVVFSKKGELVLTGSNDNSAILWDLNGNPIKKFEHDAYVTSVAISPDNKYILTGSNDKIAILWDLNGNQIRRFEGHSGTISSVLFSTGGDSILTSSFDNSAILWDLTGKRLKSFLGHDDRISSADFDIDGKRLITGSWDDTAIIWDTKGNIIQVLSDNNQNVIEASFASNGKSILTASKQKVIIWKTPKSIIEWLNEPDCPVRKLTEEEKIEYGITVEDLN